MICIKHINIVKLNLPPSIAVTSIKKKDSGKKKKKKRKEKKEKNKEANRMVMVKCNGLFIYIYIMGKSLYFNLKDAQGNNIVYTERCIILNTRKNL